MATYQQHGAPRGRQIIGGYPPAQDVIYPSVNSTSTFETKVAEDPRHISRTPSPTPSELKELKTGAIDWKTVSNWRFWIRKEWICASVFRSSFPASSSENAGYYVIFIVILVITALVTLYHKQIVEWLTPVTLWLHE